MIVVRSAIESADAPNELDLLSFPFVVSELSYRIFGETPEDPEPVTELSTAVVSAGVSAMIAAGFLVLAPVPEAGGLPLSIVAQPERASSPIRCRSGSGRSSFRTSASASALA